MVSPVPSPSQPAAGAPRGALWKNSNLALRRRTELVPVTLWFPFRSCIVNDIFTGVSAAPDFGVTIAVPSPSW
jgi:hypothetical protein